MDHINISYIKMCSRAMGSTDDFIKKVLSVYTHSMTTILSIPERPGS